jgi:endo-1,4-beta-xylanase
MMAVQKLRFLKLCVMLVLLASVIGVSAHEQPLSLREMADASGILIGAATDTWDFSSHPDLEATLTREFSSLTPENHAKMCFAQPREGEFDFTELDKLVEIAEANDMVIHGHTLVWHGCFPEWLAAKEPTREEAIEILRTHITTVVSRYKGRIALWDVVNEPFESDGQRRDTAWQRWIGDDYIQIAFEIAHEADPDARLFLNEYDAEVINAKSNAVYELVRNLRLSGVPIHGVGMQMHIAIGEVVEGGVIDPISFENNLRRVGQLGLEVAITEMDVAHQGAADENRMRQVAGHYYQIFAICVEWKAFCTSFTTWGVSDVATWLRMPEFYNNAEVAPLLFDENMQPKLAYTALLDVLARDQGLEPLLSDEEVAALTTADTVTVEVAPPQRSDPAQLAPDSTRGALYYAAFPVTIMVDGDPADWANVPRDTVFEGTLVPEGNTTKMSFAAAADNENFYFLAEVTDDRVVYGKHPPASDWYREDSVEFYINASGDLTLREYVPGIAQIAVPALNLANQEGDIPIIAGGRSGDVPVNAVVVETETGYTVEASVPLQTDVWSITPAHGTVIGFQVHLNGSSGDDRDTKLIWSAYDTEDQSWMNPAVFGQLMFWDSTK